MFFQKKGVDTPKKSINNSQVRELELAHKLAIKELETEHRLALKEKEFELKHFKDEEVKKLNATVSEQKIKIAELEKENKMLDRIVDLNGDIIDVKNLVTKLIDKLPNIDLKSLTFNNNGNAK